MFHGYKWAKRSFLVFCFHISDVTGFLLHGELWYLRLEKLNVIHLCIDITIYLNAVILSCKDKINLCISGWDQMFLIWRTWKLWFGVNLQFLYKILPQCLGGLLTFINFSLCFVCFSCTLGGRLMRMKLKPFCFRISFNFNIVCSLIKYKLCFSSRD